MRQFDKNKLLESPNPTKGHHFSDFLICPTRAWFDYYAKKEMKAPEPQYLKQAYIEGNKYEEQVYQSDEFIDSIRIPFSLNISEKIGRTKDEIIGGKHKYILQAFFNYGDTIGVADILERIDISPKAHLYRVGEIKATKELTLAHVLQIMWYDSLLKDIQGNSLESGFVILGNEEKHEIDYKEYNQIFFEIRDELLRIRDVSAKETDKVPKPVFSSYCFSCLWRYECIPLLIENKDTSLLPGVGRYRVEELSKYGIDNIQKLSLTKDEVLKKIGFDSIEIRNLKLNSILIENKLGLLKANLDSKKLKSLNPIAISINNNGKPEALFFRANNNIESVSINDNSIDYVVLSGKFSLTNLVCFGVDFAAIKKLKINNYNRNRIRAIDLFKVIEEYLHVPFPGLDLYSISEFIKSYKIEDILTSEVRRLSPEERIHAIENVLTWLIKSTERKKELNHDYSE